ncbi:MAG TPA: PQQ-binding-like beta-propeller repeat protein, partial [Vicinamibacteria bacterium]
MRLGAWLLATAAGLAAPSAEWPHFRGDAALTGAGAAELPNPLAVVWTYEAGEAIESSAAIVEGAVYVGTRGGELLALDLETGRLRWKYKAKAEEGIGESSPAVSG